MNWSAGYASDILEYLRKDIFPYIGSRSITDIKPVDMLAVLRKMEQRGVLDKLKNTSSLPADLHLCCHHR
jgi:integrase